MTTYTHLDSPLGQLLLTSRDAKLSGLYFADQSHSPKMGRDWIEHEDADIFIKTAQQLEEYASGERVRFEIPLCFSGTPFQATVWYAIACIPFGQTITYSELARRVGSSHAVRAVGTATGANPISWIIPCHRVMGKSGALTGYAGGLARKKTQLDFESARLAGRGAFLAPAEKEPALAMV